MTLSSIGILAAALAAAASTGFGLVALLRGTGRLRNELKADVEIANALPDGEPKTLLTEHIATKVTRLVAAETELRRDWPFVALATVGAVAFGWVTVWLFEHQAWWSWLLLPLAAVLALVFVYGFFESLQKRKRDARGIQIKDA
jgi:hypothetical protein